MKKYLLFAFAFLVSLQLYSCIGTRTINGNGKISEKTITFAAEYTALNVSNGIAVVLSPALTGSADIIADQAVMEYVSVTQSNGVVRVCYDPSVSVNTKITTTVTLPQSSNLSAINVSSAGKVSAENVIVTPALKINCSSAGRVEAKVESPDLQIEASSAAKCDVDALAGVCRISASSSAKCRGAFDVRELHVDISSAAGCAPEGVCDELRITATSAAAFRGFGLDAAKVFVDASSGSSVEVFAAEELGLSVSSGAAVRYKGAPQFTSNNVSSGGSLKNAN